MKLSELLKHFKFIPQVVIFDSNSEYELSLDNEGLKKWSDCILIDYEIFNDGLGCLTLYITNWRF